MTFSVTGLIFVALKALYIAFAGTEKPYIPESVGAEPEYRTAEESKLK